MKKFLTLELYEIDLCLCFKSCAPKSSINFIALQKALAPETVVVSDIL